MKIKTLVNSRGNIEEMVNEFLATVEAVDVQTHFASDRQVIAIVVYKEAEGNGR